MDDAKREVARALLDIGAVEISLDDPFTWASGLRSPVYCDNRKIISFPSVRKMVVGHLQRAASSFSFDVIAGTATAGIPHAAFLAADLDLPMVYVRSKPKGHGKSRQIEGVLEEGQRVIVIEDLISTGMSSLNAVDALVTAGAEVSGVLAIFTYGLTQAEAAFADAGVESVAVCNFSAVIEELSGQFAESELESLRTWYQDPAGWSAMF